MIGFCLANGEAAPASTPSEHKRGDDVSEKRVSAGRRFLTLLVETALSDGLLVIAGNIYSAVVRVCRPSGARVLCSAGRPTHAEPDVGCVAPRRRTRSLPHNASARFAKTKPRAWLRHTPYNGKRPSESLFYVFRRPVPYPTHAEPKAGCVAPRRHTRSLLPNAYACFSKTKPRAWLRHTPYLRAEAV